LAEWLARTRVLVDDHHDSYTYNLVHLVAGVTQTVPDVIQHDDPQAPQRWRDGYSHIVLSPGPGRVDDRGDFAVGRDIIRTSEVPVLGVCLGMQGMVDVLGGEVEVVEPAHGDVAQVRHTGTGVFTNLPQGFDAVRYHSQAAVTVPPSLVTTAWCDGPDGPVVMGVQHVSRALHGVQFHPESVLTECGDRLVANFIQGR
jgi:anthranilate synthase/aminodeoxychorismate synthase-like glutamine amidotransferase